MIEVRTSVHELDCCDACDGIPATLRYDPADPFAVHLVFEEPGQEPSEWMFARDLLVEGLEQRSGLMDVQVWPLPGTGFVAVGLASDAGRAAVKFKRRTVKRFLSITCRAVPYQQEHVDVDGLIRHIQQWWVSR